MRVCSRSNFFTTVAFFEIPLEFADGANDGANVGKTLNFLLKSHARFLS